MTIEHVRIEELVLRIPGLSAEDARQLGQTVVQQLAEGLPENLRSRHLGALDIQVTMPAGTSRQQLAERIAAAILEKLP